MLTQPDLFKGTITSVWTVEQNHLTVKKRSSLPVSHWIFLDIFSLGFVPLFLLSYCDHFFSSVCQPAGSAALQSIGINGNSVAPQINPDLPFPHCGTFFFFFISTFPRFTSVLQAVCPDHRNTVSRAGFTEHVVAEWFQFIVGPAHGSVGCHFYLLAWMQKLEQQSPPLPPQQSLQTEMWNVKTALFINTDWKSKNVFKKKKHKHVPNKTLIIEWMLCFDMDYIWRHRSF